MFFWNIYLFFVKSLITSHHLSCAGWEDMCIDQCFFQIYSLWRQRGNSINLGFENEENQANLQGIDFTTRTLIRYLYYYFIGINLFYWQLMDLYFVPGTSPSHYFGAVQLEWYRHCNSWREWRDYFIQHCDRILLQTPDRELRPGTTQILKYD